MIFCCKLSTAIIIFLIGISYLTYQSWLFHASQHYRLPDSIRPESYKLKIFTNLEDPNNLQYNGRVKIKIFVLERTQNITLHAKRNYIIDRSSIQVSQFKELQDATQSLRKIPRSIPIDTIRFNPIRDYLIIGFKANLEKDLRYELTIEFSGPLSKDFNGYFYTSYVGLNGSRSYMSFTQFQPIGARAAFPCFDEPHLKAKFTISLGHREDLNALSNMPIRKTRTYQGKEKYVWSIFQESPAMSTYLVAFSINDLATKHQTVSRDLTLRCWARNAVIEQCTYANKLASKLIPVYENLSNIKYPFEILDFVALPNSHWKGMENWGIISFHESSLLINASTSTLAEKQTVAKTMAHEAAHQWFGNLVTMKWWNDIWLNEGFATYMANLALQAIKPEWDSYNENSFDDFLAISQKDSQRNTHPLSQKIVDSNKIRQSFDAITYRKGSAILRMLHLMVGKSKFLKVLRIYFDKHKYAYAKQDDLWQTFTEHSNVTLPSNFQTIMHSWTRQTGYPLLRVKRNYQSKSVKITQERFLGKYFKNARNTNRCWWIPVTLTTASKKDFTLNPAKIWLQCHNKTGKSISLKLENYIKNDDWILVNIQLSGFYRVMYDQKNWELLSKTLNSPSYNRIHYMNRAQLLSDIIVLTQKGEVELKMLFDILEYLKREEEHLPWKVALKELVVAEKYPPAFRNFKSYLSYLIQPVYITVNGLNGTNTSTIADVDADSAPTKALLKSLICEWSCLKLNILDCIESAKQHFGKWKSEFPSAQPPFNSDMKPIIMCTAIHHGTFEDFLFLWRIWKNIEKDDSEKLILEKALKCYKNKNSMKVFGIIQ